jgi:hypothetical protein
MRWVGMSLGRGKEREWWFGCGGGLGRGLGFGPEGSSRLARIEGVDGLRAVLPELYFCKILCDKKNIQHSRSR